jgi:hypothetical protein
VAVAQRQNQIQHVDERLTKRSTIQTASVSLSHGLDLLSDLCRVTLATLRPSPCTATKLKTPRPGRIEPGTGRCHKIAGHVFLRSADMLLAPHVEGFD